MIRIILNHSLEVTDNIGFKGLIHCNYSILAEFYDSTLFLG